MEEGSGAEGLAKVAGKRTDIGSFAAADAYLGVRKIKARNIRVMNPAAGRGSIVRGLLNRDGAAPAE